MTAIEEADAALAVAKSALRWNEAGQRPDIASALRNLIDATERLRGPITDAQVDAAVAAYRWHSVGPAGMRAVLEAARDAS
jgi:hypothetical protein